MSRYLLSGRLLEGVSRRIVERVSKGYAITECPELVAHVRLVAFPGIIYLDMLRVNYAYRELGIAKKLLKEITAHSERAQRPIFLSVVPQDEKTTTAGLYRLYQSAGFVYREGRLPYPATKDKLVDLIYWPAAVRLPRRRSRQPYLLTHKSLSLAA